MQESDKDPHPPDLTDTTQQVVEDAKTKGNEIDAEFEARLNALGDKADAAAKQYRAKQAQQSRMIKQSNSEARGLGYGLTYAYVLIGTPIVFYGIGFLIDRVAHTNLAGIAALIGSVAGFGAMLFMINRDGSRS